MKACNQDARNATKPIIKYQTGCVDVFVLEHGQSAGVVEDRPAGYEMRYEIRIDGRCMRVHRILPPKKPETEKSWPVEHVSAGSPDFFGKTFRFEVLLGPVSSRMSKRFSPVWWRCNDEVMGFSYGWSSP